MKRLAIVFALALMVLAAVVSSASASGTYSKKVGCKQKGNSIKVVLLGKQQGGQIKIKKIKYRVFAGGSQKNDFALVGDGMVKHKSGDNLNGNGKLHRYFPRPFWLVQGHTYTFSAAFDRAGTDLVCSATLRA